MAFPTKYHNRRCWSALLKRHFDSEAERKYGEHLFARQMNGEISDLAFQVRWDCEVNGVRIGNRYMRLDFRYFDGQLAEMVWDDYKGFATPEWKLKADIWAAGGPGVLRITRKAPKASPLSYVHDEIRPIRPTIKE